MRGDTVINLSGVHISKHQSCTNVRVVSQYFCTCLRFMRATLCATCWANRNVCQLHYWADHHWQVNDILAQISFRFHFKYVCIQCKYEIYRSYVYRCYMLRITQKSSMYISKYVAGIWEWCTTDNLFVECAAFEYFARYNISFSISQRYVKTALLCINHPAYCVGFIRFSAVGNLWVFVKIALYRLSWQNSLAFVHLFRNKKPHNMIVVQQHSNINIDTCFCIRCVLPDRSRFGARKAVITISISGLCRHDNSI